MWGFRECEISANGSLRQIQIVDSTLFAMYTVITFQMNSIDTWLQDNWDDDENSEKKIGGRLIKFSLYKIVCSNNGVHLELT